MQYFFDFFISEKDKVLKHAILKCFLYLKIINMYDIINRMFSTAGAIYRAKALFMGCYKKRCGINRGQHRI